MAQGGVRDTGQSPAACRAACCAAEPEAGGFPMLHHVSPSFPEAWAELGCPGRKEKGVTEAGASSSSDGLRLWGRWLRNAIPRTGQCPRPPHRARRGRRGNPNSQGQFLLPGGLSPLLWPQVRTEGRRGAKRWWRAAAEGCTQSQEKTLAGSGLRASWACVGASGEGAFEMKL